MSLQFRSGGLELVFARSRSSAQKRTRIAPPHSATKGQFIVPQPALVSDFAGDDLDQLKMQRHHLEVVMQVVFIRPPKRSASFFCSLRLLVNIRSWHRSNWVMFAARSTRTSGE
jgi:hypothetical protein